MSLSNRNSHFSISVAARLTGLHVNTLRKYERHGLIAPERTAGNQRSFSADDVARLAQIKRLVEDQGVNLAGVGIALAVTDRIRSLGWMPEPPPDDRSRAVGQVMDEILLALRATAGPGRASPGVLEDKSD
jgi:DNA-binding transcriptional MerR regulator